MLKTLGKIDRKNIVEHKQRKHMKTKCQHHTKWEKIGSLSTKIWNETGMATVTTTLQHVLEVLARAISKEKELKESKLEARNQNDLYCR